MYIRKCLQTEKLTDTLNAKNASLLPEFPKESEKLKFRAECANIK